LTLSVSRAWASQLAADHAHSGLSCRVLDGLPFCLARAVAMSQTPNIARHPVAAVDWGFGQATLCVVHQGAPQFVRPLRDCRWQNLLDALAQSIGGSHDQAELLLAANGLALPGEKANEAQRMIASGVGDELERMVAELDRTIGYLRAYRRGSAPESLMLFGGGAAIRGIDAFLEDRLGLPVHPWSMELASGQSPCNAPLALFGAAAALSVLKYETR
jgi:Tfp pilus assembly PilM family ATPase